MAQLAIGLAGGISVSALSGGAIPFGVGFAASSFLAGHFFGPGLPTVTGPRLTDLRIQSSAHGQPKVRLHGTHKVAAHVIWSSGIKETSVKDEVGGKGALSPSQTVVSFVYSVDLALFWTEGPMGAVLEILGDGKLVADYTTTSGTVVGNGDWEHYLGTETQEPSPLIQADKGVDATSAYRGDCYSTVRDFQLQNHGNRVPNFTAVIASEASATAPQFSQAMGAGGAPASDSVFHYNREADLMAWKSSSAVGWDIFAPESLNYVGRAAWRDALFVVQNANDGGAGINISSTSSNTFNMDRAGEHVFALSLGGSSEAALIKAKIWDGAITAVLGRESNFLGDDEFQRGHEIYTGWGLSPRGFTDADGVEIIDRLTIGISYGRDPTQLLAFVGDGAMLFLGQIKRAATSGQAHLNGDLVGVPAIDREYGVWICGETTTGSPTLVRLHEIDPFAGPEVIRTIDITSAMAGFGDGLEVDLAYRFEEHELLLFRAGYAWKFDIESAAITGAALAVYNHGAGADTFGALLRAGPDGDGIMLTRGEVGGADQDFTLNRLDLDDWSVELGKYTLCSAPGSLDTSLSHAAGLIEIAACHA